MNLPNKLTVSRIILTPVFLLLFTVSAIPFHYILALLVFGIASITDMLDGQIARKNNIVTTFGKLTDPLADKMLTTAAFLGFMMMGYCNIWIVFIILFREFGISSIRLVASAEGVVIPANMWGKAKTVSQMISMALVMFLLSLQFDFGILPEAVPLAIISNVLFGITAVLTVVSGVTYVIEGTKVIDFSK